MRPPRYGLSGVAEVAGSRAAFLPDTVVVGAGASSSSGNLGFILRSDGTRRDSTRDRLPQKQVVEWVQSSYLQAREGARAAIVVKIVDVESLKKTEGRVLWTR